MGLWKFFLCVFCLVCSSHGACAYLDPGTGSMLFQALIAGFVGVVYVFRYQIARAKGVVAKLFTRR